MSLSFEQWTREAPEAIRRTPEVAKRQLRDLGPRALRSVRERAPVGSGALRDSFRLTEGEDGETISSDDPAAEALETGSPITGRPWLGIPMPGTPRLLGPRSDGQKLFVLRSRDGRLFLATRTGGVLRLWWKLQQEVQPRRAPFIGDAIQVAAERFPEQLLDALNRSVTR